MVRSDDGALGRGVAFLAAALVVSLAGFYLFPSGKVNSFPTYLVAVAALLLAAVSPRGLKAFVHARAALCCWSISWG